MTEPSRTIHLVDDDEAVRRSTSFLLRAAGYVVKTYASGVEFLDAGKDIARGCVLLDVHMPEIDGFGVQKKLAERDMVLPVVVMTAHGDTITAVRAMKNGAVDFIEKPFHRGLLVETVEHAFTRLEQTSRRHVRAEAARARLQELTPRELQVLEGLARGHPNKTIAFDLGISPRTVEIHRANLMSKLSVASLSDALRTAFAAGLGMDADPAVPAGSRTA